MPCQNSATCHDGVNSYTCSCATGWTGVNCESGEYQLADLDLEMTFKRPLKDLEMTSVILKWHCSWNWTLQWTWFLCCWVDGSTVNLVSRREKGGGDLDLELWPWSDLNGNIWLFDHKMTLKDLVSWPWSDTDLEIGPWNELDLVMTLTLNFYLEVTFTLKLTLRQSWLLDYLELKVTLKSLVKVWREYYRLPTARTRGPPWKKRVLKLLHWGPLVLAMGNS